MVPDVVFNVENEAEAAVASGIGQCAYDFDRDRIRLFLWVKGWDVGLARYETEQPPSPPSSAPPPPLPPPPHRLLCKYMNSKYIYRGLPKERIQSWESTDLSHSHKRQIVTDKRGIGKTSCQSRERKMTG